MRPLEPMALGQYIVPVYLELRQLRLLFGTYDDGDLSESILYFLRAIPN